MDFSESSFLRAQGLGWNETSAVGGTGTLWSSIYDGVYFAANEWVTVDKGLNRLAEAFHPVVDNRLTYGRRIEALGYNETTGKTSIHWKQDGEKQSREYDKTVVAVPFSVARLWRTPRLSPVMSEAIIGLGYAFACKVAVSTARSEYKLTAVVVSDSVLGAHRSSHFWRMRHDRPARNRIILLSSLQHQWNRTGRSDGGVFYSSRAVHAGHVGGRSRAIGRRGDGRDSRPDRRGAVHRCLRQAVLGPGSRRRRIVGFTLHRAARALHAGIPQDSRQPRLVSSSPGAVSSAAPDPSVSVNTPPSTMLGSSQRSSQLCEGWCSFFSMMDWWTRRSK